MAEMRACEENDRMLNFVMAKRKAAGFSIRVVFNDGSPDFTGHYRSIEERNRKMEAARRLLNFAGVEVMA